MNIGKVSETILKRSVLNQLKKRRQEVLVRPGIGEDCAIVQLEADELLVLSSDPITGTGNDVGTLAVHITANDLASSGAEVVGLLVTILLPPETEEVVLKNIVKEVERVCADLGIEVIGGHTEVSVVVNQPLISITGVGKVKKGKVVTTSGAKPNQDLVLTKWAGLEGTAILSNDKEWALKEKLPAHLVDRAKDLKQYLSVIPEARIACNHDVSAMHDVTEGGVFGALWEMAAASRIGFDVDLKSIPIKQETIEICEVLNLNPYMLISSGCMLMATENGLELVEKLKEAGVSAAVIGKTTEGNDKCVTNGEERRYLGPPDGDELYKALG